MQDDMDGKILHIILHGKLEELLITNALFE